MAAVNRPWRDADKTCGDHFRAHDAGDRLPARHAGRAVWRAASQAEHAASAASRFGCGRWRSSRRRWPATWVAPITGSSMSLSPQVAAVLWKVTTISMGVASFLLLTAAISAAFTRAGPALAHRRRGAQARDLRRVDARTRRVPLRDLRLRLDARRSCCCSWSPSGRTASPATARTSRRASCVSIAAAAVQQSGVRLHQHFNHNDLMHVVQMGGVWLLYKGGARLRDAGGLHGPQP